jgi:galactokinase
MTPPSVARARAAFSAIARPGTAARAALSATALREMPPSASVRVAVAPGRVNLIGEHTDYNDGFVLPMAIPASVAAAFAPRSDGRIVAASADFAPGERWKVELSSAPEPGWPEWLARIVGVAWALSEDGIPFGGLEVAVAGDVPIGAGLSSSAALEVAVARALYAAAGRAWEPARVARAAARAEREFAGVRCGLMDPFASAAAVEGSALLVDCRDLSATAVPIPEEVAVVVLDTGVRRSLAGSEYNDRRAACERAVDALGGVFGGRTATDIRDGSAATSRHVRDASEARRTAPHVRDGSAATSRHGRDVSAVIGPAPREGDLRALRDVDEVMLARARPLMDEEAYRRALHVVRENSRPAALAFAFARGDLAAAGALLDASHESLRDLYEVSSSELDRMTALARTHPHGLGARLTGAGFGGCVVALAERAGAERLIDEVVARYRAETGLAANGWVAPPSRGAHVLEVPV